MSGGWNKKGGGLFGYFDANDVNVLKFAYVYEKSWNLWKGEKSAEAMWKQIFQIQKYDLVNWKSKWNSNSKWEVISIKN